MTVYLDLADRRSSRTASPPAPDPRYQGDPDWAVWGTWEYHVLTESKLGNLVRPMNDKP